MAKTYLGMSVLEAARGRISIVFDNFPKIYLSFSGGKDSTIMLHLVMDEAIKRGRKIGVLFVDLEGQYKITIDHIQAMYDLYADNIEPFWCCLPIALRNAVSQYEPKWTCWEPERKADWIRQPPQIAITDHNYFPFYKYDMEFEEFVPEFGYWYGGGNLTACFVGIRTGESLNRWRTVASDRKQTFYGHKWTTWTGDAVYNVYPIYDWHTDDIWVYHAKFPKRPYNRLYNLMHQAGLTPHQMRICQPYGDDQRKGLWLFHLIEPETWAKVVARVNGANSGALYANEKGNILGNGKVTRPEGHTWESFCMFMLDTMPPQTAEHYKNKIALFLKWWQEEGYETIPDEASYEDERDKKVPSWRRIAKVLVRGDYWCKGLSFSQTKSGSAYEAYKKLMKKRRNQWNIFA